MFEIIVMLIVMLALLPLALTNLKKMWGDRDKLKKMWGDRNKLKKWKWPIMWCILIWWIISLIVLYFQRSLLIEIGLFKGIM